MRLALSLSLAAAVGLTACASKTLVTLPAPAPKPTAAPAPSASPEVKVTEPFFSRTKSAVATLSPTATSGVSGLVVFSGGEIGRASCRERVSPYV